LSERVLKLDAFLKGKVALVTGGASGIGRACALALADAGAAVAVGSLLSRGESPRHQGEIIHLPGHEALDETQRLIESCGVSAFAAELDVTSEDSVASFVARMREALGPADILVNAAGMTVEHAVRDHPTALWDKVIAVNLTGVFRVTRACLPVMLDRGWGRIVNIASTSASVGSPTSAAYAASKAGVVGFSRCVALEGAPRGVTCNTISPTWVETRFGVQWMTHLSIDRTQSEAQVVAEATRSTPMGRPLRPEEVAGLALYLCRPEAQMVTMQDLTISGGSLW
jgi:3-hydroxybutyrate dehydrogenase